MGEERFTIEHLDTTLSAHEMLDTIFIIVLNERMKENS